MFLFKSMLALTLGFVVMVGSALALTPCSSFVSCKAPSMPCTSSLEFCNNDPSLLLTCVYKYDLALIRYKTCIQDLLSGCINEANTTTDSTRLKDIFSIIDSFQRSL